MGSYNYWTDMPEPEPAERNYVPALITAGAIVLAALLGIVGSCIARSSDNGDDDVEVMQPAVATESAVTTESATTTEPAATTTTEPAATTTTEPATTATETTAPSVPECDLSGQGDLIDDPEWSPDKAISGRNEGWRGGDPVGGVGEPQYYGGAKYAFASGVGGWDQTNSEATWHLGQRAGSHKIEVHIPPNHSTATVMYHIYRNRDLLMSVTVNQAIAKGWVELASSIHLGDEPGEITVRVEFRDSLPAGNIPGPEGQSIAIDAMRIRCV